MSYSCAENVAQLSRASDGLSILQECRGKKRGLTHESCKGPEIAEQANKMAGVYCSLSPQEWQTMIKPDSNQSG